MPTLDARQRLSAINIGSPWRGLNVLPSLPINSNTLAAAMFLYGIFPETIAATIATGGMYGTITGKVDDMVGRSTAIGAHNPDVVGRTVGIRATSTDIHGRGI